MKRKTFAGLQEEVAALEEKLRVASEPKVEIVGSFAYKMSHEQHGGGAYESTDHFQSLKIVGGVPFSQVEQWQDTVDAAAKKAALKSANKVVVAIADGTFKKTVNLLPPREPIPPRPRPATVPPHQTSSTDDEVRRVRENAIAERLEQQRSQRA